MATMTKVERAPWSERLGAVLEAGGVGHVIRHIGRKLASPLAEWGHLGFYARDLDGVLPVPVSHGLELRQASMADLPRLLYPSRTATAESLAERFGRGHLCFVAIDRDDGPAAHARWVSTDLAYIPELGCDVILAPGEAYMYDGFTRPDARGSGVDGAIRCQIFQSLREAGFRRVYSYVRSDNPVGVRAAGRWQRPAGIVRYLRFRGSRPFVWTGHGQHPRLVRADERAGQERAERAEALRSWFKSWLSAPLANRSTGYHALPDEYFSSTAQYVVDTLGLDAGEDHVLDVGCDSAMVSRRVAPHCRRFVGVDFMPELLIDARRAGAFPAEANSAFAAADGRQLPFASGAYSKVYCVGVVHCMPSRKDGLAMIRDLVRVCAPGGTVLVGAVPDRAKRWVRRLDLWKENGWAQRLRLLASLVIPPGLKPLLRRMGIGRSEGPSFLDYDMDEIRRFIGSDGIRAQVLAFPDEYWNRDFRRTRSNLVLRKLPETPGSL
jgi:ubiquinone/menaquinone biosynthesis C-methylase UbiE/ribosomal protein S18 acetylase RimI-like enzyme